MSGVDPGDTDRSIFDKCYVVKEGAKKIKSSVMLEMLIKAGCNFKNVKQLNPWVQAQFGSDERVAGPPKTHIHGAAAWQGFARVAC